MSKKTITPPVIIEEETEDQIIDEIIIENTYSYEDGSMYYPTQSRTKHIFLRHISYFKSNGNDTELHYVDRTVDVINLSLKSIDAAMNQEDFMRISNIYVMNLHESAGMSNKKGFVVLMKIPRTAYGQIDNTKGGEIELVGSPDKKAEYLLRQARFGIDVKRKK